LLLAACQRAARPTDPAYVAAIEKWRAERVADLKRPDGWLASAGLFWLSPGENRFGAARTCALVFPAGKTPAEAGSFVLDHGQVTLRVRRGVPITAGGRPVATLALAADVDSGGPTKLALGPLRFYVIRRGARVGVRLRDEDRPERTRFAGVDCYPIDAGWRVRARFEPYSPPREIPITNVLGDVSREKSPGALVFERGGRTYRLDAIPESDSDSLFVIFGDPTNGRETYGAGRFIDAPAPDSTGTVDLDFNKAYNPPCAFTPYATCPLPPAQNRLALAVTAGEKNYGSHGR
jgi:hypothetical protein